MLVGSHTKIKYIQWYTPLICYDSKSVQCELKYEDFCFSFLIK